MKISLPPELEQFVQEKMASGRYSVPSEVIWEALWLLKAQDEHDQCRLEALRREIAIGLEQAAKGQTKRFDPEDLKRRIRERVTRDAEERAPEPA